MNAETRLRATEIVLNEQLVEHEAGHAAAALLQDVEVDEIHAPFLTLADTADADMSDPAGWVSVLRAEPDDRDGLRKRAIAVLAPRLDEVGWPKRWPLTLAPQEGDEAQLSMFVKQLGLDEDGYGQLVADAYEIVASSEYARLRLAIGHVLGRHGRLDALALKRLKAITQGGDGAVEHVTFKAVTTVSTEQGTFEAVISTATIDRERDVVVPEAMVKALSAWTALGKLVPLAWQHSTAAEDLIGNIDPATAKAVNGEVVASGWIDQSTERGLHAWRCVKSGTLGFSFGYLIPEGGAVKRADGVREIRELDVFEVSATPTPMNGDTRVLGWKSIDADAEFDRVRAEWRESTLRYMGGMTDPADRLRAKANRITREYARVEIVSFEC